MRSRRSEVDRRGLGWCKHPSDGESYADKFCLLTAWFLRERPKNTEEWAAELLRPRVEVPPYFISSMSSEQVARLALDGVSVTRVYVHPDAPARLRVKP